jgi:hypothetical protein
MKSEKVKPLALEDALPPWVVTLQRLVREAKKPT